MILNKMFFDRLNKSGQYLIISKLRTIQLLASEKMDLKQYKTYRAKKFPLPSATKAEKQKQKASYITNIGLISCTEAQSYQIRINKQKCVVMFNDHEYLKREFSLITKQGHESNQAAISDIIYQMKPNILGYDNNLIIYNALDLIAVEDLIYPIKREIQADKNKSRDGTKPNNEQQQNQYSISPESTLKSLIQALIQKKRPNSVITLSVLQIKSDGSLSDQLNYDWIQQSKYIDDLINVKNRNKLKVRKYKSEVKTFDLNRQLIKSWKQGQQILSHYFQIKDYLQCWKQDLNPTQTPKIGQLYELSQVDIDEELGFINKTYRRKCIVKLNQFMPESNLVMMKLSQLLKERVGGAQLTNTRDCPIVMFLRDCFERYNNYHYTVLTQIGTNQTLKQEAICLSMDLQVPGVYTYLKNYCDKPDIVEQIKQIAVTFVPLTIKQRSDMKLNSLNSIPYRIKPKTIKTLQQNEKIQSKLFSYNTYSSNEKKRNTYNNTYQVHTVMEKSNFNRNSRGGSSSGAVRNIPSHSGSDIFYTERKPATASKDIQE